MKKKKCPYCGSRVPYTVAFSRRRKAEYVCRRCGRESRVVINRSVVLAFLICAIISAAVLFIWIYLGLTHNPLGIAAVALPLIIFALISPKFVSFEPLRKYQKSMEAKKAGIAYSDNLSVSDTDSDLTDSGRFSINSDIFNQIKAERSSTREQVENDEISSTSTQVEKPMVHVIDDVSEGHAIDDAPLKKIHSEGTRVNRHYITPPEPEPAPEEDDVREYQPDNNRYSANRRF